MKTNVVCFETVTSLERFESLQHHWHDLWTRAGGGFNQSFAFCLHTLKEIAIPRRSKLHCVVAWEGDRLVLAWPLMRYREMLWRALCPLAPDGSVGMDVLIEAGPHAEARVEAAWRALTRAAWVDLLSLPRVRAASPLFTLASRHRSVERADAQQTAVVHSIGEWDVFRQTLAPRARKELDGYKRRLGKEGELSLYRADLRDPSSLGLIDDLFRWKAKWVDWTARQGIFFSPEYRAFLIRLLSEGDDAATFRLFVLALNGQPIALNLVAVDSHAVHGVQAAFDQAFGKFTPGAVLLEHVVRWAYESGHNFDFGAGGGKYKTVWAGDSGYACTDFRLSTNVWGKVAFMLADVWRRYRARAEQRQNGRSAAPVQPLRSELEP